MTTISAKHEHKFDEQVKRKVKISHHGATIQNPRPGGTIVGHDELLMRACKCGAVEAYDLERHLA